MFQGIEAGELAKWLRVVADNTAAGAPLRAVPQQFVEYLTNLRCAELDSTGMLRITSKGQLALRMEAPDALHRQEDPDEVKPDQADIDQAQADQKRTRSEDNDDEA